MHATVKGANLIAKPYPICDPQQVVAAVVE